MPDAWDETTAEFYGRDWLDELKDLTYRLEHRLPLMGDEEETRLLRELRAATARDKRQKVPEGNLSEYVPHLTLIQGGQCAIAHSENVVA